MARLALLVSNSDDANDQVLIEINGSNDWVKEMSTAIHGFFEAVERHVPFEIENAEQAQEELRKAFDMAQDGDSFAGEIVTTAITIK